MKEELPGSKPRGAISFQSKANELPQSTTRVLINIHAFAFKSSPIYGSIPFHLGNTDATWGGSPEAEEFCFSPPPNTARPRHRVNIESVLVVKFLVIRFVANFLIHRPRALSESQIFGGLVCTLMGRRSARRRPRSGSGRAHHSSGIRSDGAPDLHHRLLLNGSTSDVQPDGLIAFVTATPHLGGDLG